MNTVSTIGFRAIRNPSSLINALLVSPFESDHAVLRHVFSQSNWRLLAAYDCESALALMSRELIPVVICGLRGGDWKFLLEVGARLAHPPRLIVSSRVMDEHLWAEVLNLGGYDVLATPFDPREVFRSVSLAWHSWQREWRSAPVPLKAALLPGEDERLVIAHATAS